MSLLSNTSLGLVVFRVETRIGRLDNLKGTSQKKKVKVSAPDLMVEWILMFSLIGQLLLRNILIDMKRLIVNGFGLLK